MNLANNHTFLRIAVTLVVIGQIVWIFLYEFLFGSGHVGEWCMVVPLFLQCLGLSFLCFDLDRPVHFMQNSQCTLAVVVSLLTSFSTIGFVQLIGVFLYFSFKGYWGNSAFIFVGTVLFALSTVLCVFMIIELNNVSHTRYRTQSDRSRCSNSGSYTFAKASAPPPTMKSTQLCSMCMVKSASHLAECQHKFCFECLNDLKVEFESQCPFCKKSIGNVRDIDVV